MSGYKRTVKAALSETNSKFALAEALALDIPPSKGGRGNDDVREALVDARTAIIEAGGEERSVATLNDYRKTALWVGYGNSGVRHPSLWVAGLSYTAHQEAMKAGLTPQAFAADPKPARRTRIENGRASKDGDPKNVVEGWSKEQRKKAVAEIVKTEGAESVTRVAAEADLDATFKATADEMTKAGARAVKESQAEALEHRRKQAGAPSVGGKKRMTDKGAGDALMHILQGVLSWETASRFLSEPGLVIDSEEREALIDAITRTSAAMLSAEELVRQNVRAT